jgi:hypothetical protein
MNNIINIHSAKAVDQEELDKILHEKEQKLKEECKINKEKKFLKGSKYVWLSIYVLTEES